MIIEWNQHIFSPDTTAYPLHERAVYRPDVSKNAADPLAAAPEAARSTETTAPSVGLSTAPQHRARHTAKEP